MMVGKNETSETKLKRFRKKGQKRRKTENRKKKLNDEEDWMRGKGKKPKGGVTFLWLEENIGPNWGPQKGLF